MLSCRDISQPSGPLVTVKGGEYCGVSQRVNVFVHPRYSFSFPFGESVKEAKVYAEAKAAALFELHHDRERTSRTSLDRSRPSPTWYLRGSVPYCVRLFRYGMVFVFLNRRPDEVRGCKRYLSRGPRGLPTWSEKATGHPIGHCGWN